MAKSKIRYNSKAKYTGCKPTSKAKRPKFSKCKPVSGKRRK